MYRINYYPLISLTELAFLETSALTGENVEEVFLKCTRSILTKIDAGMPCSVGAHNIQKYYFR